MSIKYFNLLDGSLEFHDQKLIIFDQAKRNRITFLLMTIGGLIYSIVTTIKGYKYHDNGEIWVGLILTILWILASIYRRKQFQKVENEIFLSDISRVTFSIDKFDGSTLAKIMTKNNQQRRIKIIQEGDQDFDFKNLLVENNIKID